MEPPLREKQFERLAGPAVALLTLAVFWPAIGLPFLDIDDPLMITANPYITHGLTLASIRWAFTTYYSSLWHPLTWLSYMLDVRLYGLDPRGLHLTGLLLHAASAWMLYAFLKRTTRRPLASAFAACVFALHPLRVESVAWVGERKDELFAFFYLSTLLAYARYAEMPTGLRYGASLALGACALMSKPMAVTLPVVLLIVDFWPLRRFALTRRILAEKVPFAALAGAVCLLTMLAQGPFVAHRFPWSWRLPAVPLFYAEYLGKMFWPTNLSLYYGHPGPALSWPAASAAAALTAAMTVIAIRERDRRPYLLAGWLWFLVMLLPVIGLVQITGRSIANRFTYLPHVGVIVAATWALAESRGRRRLLATGAVLVVLACAAATRAELRAWAEPGLLYERTLRTVPGNELFHNIYGVYLARRSDYVGARREFERSIALKPDYADAHNNLGYLFSLEGLAGPARAELEEALRLDPADDRAKANLARLSATSGLRRPKTRRPARG